MPRRHHHNQPPRRRRPRGEDQRYRTAEDEGDRAVVDRLHHGRAEPRAIVDEGRVIPAVVQDVVVYADMDSGRGRWGLVVRDVARVSGGIVQSVYRGGDLRFVYALAFGAEVAVPFGGEGAAVFAGAFCCKGVDYVGAAVGGDGRDRGWLYSYALRVLDHEFVRASARSVWGRGR